MPKRLNKDVMQEAFINSQMQQQQRFMQGQGVVNNVFIQGQDRNDSQLQLKAYCHFRLTCYETARRQCAMENTIESWTLMLQNYFSHDAKERWCYSRCDDCVGQHTVNTGVSQEAWQCQRCHYTFGKRYEATIDELPGLNKAKFDGGMTAETLFLDASTTQFDYKEMKIKYERSSHRFSCNGLRVQHKGQLFVVFAPDLKIQSWEFCAETREELISRQLVMPQVAVLAHTGNEYQDKISKSRSSLVSNEDLQRICEGFSKTVGQLANIIDLTNSRLRERQFPGYKMYTGVNSLRDLTGSSQQHSNMPNGRLASYSQEAVHPGLVSHMNDNSCIFGQNSVSHYQQFLYGQNSMNSGLNGIEQEPYRPFNSPFPASVSSLQEPPINVSLNGLSSYHQQQQLPVEALLEPNYQQSSQGNLSSQHMMPAMDNNEVEWLQFLEMGQHHIMQEEQNLQFFAGQLADGPVMHEASNTFTAPITGGLQVNRAVLRNNELATVCSTSGYTNMAQHQQEHSLPDEVLAQESHSTVNEAANSGSSSNEGGVGSLSGNTDMVPDIH